MEYPSDLVISGRSFDVEYEVSKKLTSSVRIKNGKVVLKLSRFLRGGRREETIVKFLRWAEKRLQKVSCEELIEPVYEDGGFIYTHNKVYQLSVKLSGLKRAHAFLKNQSVIELDVPQTFEEDDRKRKIRELCEKLILEDQTAYLYEVVDELNQLHFQEKYNILKFKMVKSRFGSCSSRGNINIAFRLLFAPKEVFKYVCVHELAHLKEMNHSKRFWALVEGAMPEYKDSEKWLRENGFLLG